MIIKSNLPHFYTFHIQKSMPRRRDKGSDTENAQSLKKTHSRSQMKGKQIFSELTENKDGLEREQTICLTQIIV